MKRFQDLRNILVKIYGDDRGDEAFKRLSSKIGGKKVNAKTDASFFSQEDTILITYGDTLRQKGDTPLKSLDDFLLSHMDGLFSVVHLLPFYPFSSDDGFSVMDFYQVDPDLGSWDDVESIRKNCNLMFDYVLNHISSKSKWFKNYLAGREGFKNLAIEVDPSEDLSEVTRPRSLPLLTKFIKTNGESVSLWTTFSEDQIDLNYKSLDLLEKMIDVLLFYVERGVSIIRLDAVAYLWKEIGTNCIHLPKTHEMVRLFRAVLNLTAPHVMILTETNVPHVENISYFGNGENEAQMVYNFTLPPLLFYTLVKEDSSILSSWAKNLYLKSDKTTFFNFTASHDGIGVRPLEGIVPNEEIEDLVKIVSRNGGDVSMKQNPDGSQSPYELNITYVDALYRNGDSAGEYHVDRFLASQAIKYSLPGVPATYIHSILGSRNWTEGVKQTKRPRTINREKLEIKSILNKLNDPDSFRARIFFPYVKMIKIRKTQPAFHPNSSFEIMDFGPRIFAIKRHCKDQTIYALINISSINVEITLPEQLDKGAMDLISGDRFAGSRMSIEPYRYLWLVAL